MTSRKKIVLATAAVAVSVLALAGALMAFSGNPNLMESEFRVIVTNSMDGTPQPYDMESIPVNSFVAVHKVRDGDLSGIEVGDVVGFYSATLKGNLYHRVVTMDEENRIIVVKGDNSLAMDVLDYSQINGVVVNVNHPVGEVIVFLKEHALPLALIVVLLFAMSEVLSRYLELRRQSKWNTTQEK